MACNENREVSTTICWREEAGVAAFFYLTLPKMARVWRPCILMCPVTSEQNPKRTLDGAAVWRKGRGASFPLIIGITSQPSSANQSGALLHDARRHGAGPGFRRCQNASSCRPIIKRKPRCGGKSSGVTRAAWESRFLRECRPPVAAPARAEPSSRRHCAASCHFVAMLILAKLSAWR